MQALSRCATPARTWSPSRQPRQRATFDALRPWAERGRHHPAAAPSARPEERRASAADDGDRRASGGSPCCRSCPSGTRSAPPRCSTSTAAESAQSYADQVGGLISTLAQGFGQDTVNVVMAHLTVVGGDDRRRRARRAHDLRVRGAGDRLPGRRALRRARPPAPRAGRPAPAPSGTAAARSRSTSASRRTSRRSPRRGHREHRGAGPRRARCRSAARCGRSAAPSPSCAAPGHRRRLAAGVRAGAAAGGPARGGAGAAAERPGGAHRPGAAARPRVRRARRRTGPAAPRASCSPTTSASKGHADDATVRSCSTSCTTRSRWRGADMRPHPLDMDGFTAFREPTTVDFTDTDFFALVGPTGSGKSTVIDAITLRPVRHRAPLGRPAGHRQRARAVGDRGHGSGSSSSPAGERYVLARVVRRDGKGAVTTKHAGLEALPPRLRPVPVRHRAQRRGHGHRARRHPDRGGPGGADASSGCRTSSSPSAWCCRRASSRRSCTPSPPSGRRSW